MTLFADRDDETVPPRGPVSRVRRAGRILLVIALLSGVVLAFVPPPYAIEVPGPAFNTLGIDRPAGTSGSASSGSAGSTAKLITVPGQTTYPTTGSLDLLTVSVIGTPDRRPSWFQVVRAWFERSQAVVPITELYPAGQSEKQQNAQNTQLMVDSQKDAIAAALNTLHDDVTQRVEVLQVLPKGAAAGVLAAGDDILGVGGTTVSSISGLRQAVEANGSGGPVALEILRKGTRSTVHVTPQRQDGVALLGVGVGMDYHFPFQVKIRLDDVGGPSAGMMFALGIIDTLTPGSLNGGARVAGTGTIDNRGIVGPIGGIRQKLYGARNAGAHYFLAPKQNCNEVTGHVPHGIRVFAVSTLGDSLKVLTALRTKSPLGSLPTCPAG